MYWTLELASKLEDAPWPATKDELIDFAYPYLVANVGGGLDVTWPPSWYAVAYVGALVCYLVVEALLMRRVNRIAPTEALQTRE